MLLKKDSTGLWIVDVQEKLFPLVDRSHQVLEQICFAVEVGALLELPIVVTEQYPEGLGMTVEPVKKRLPPSQIIHEKTTFSGYHETVFDQTIDTWILAGIEAHICILQTTKELLAHGKRVVILNDAISSRSMFDFSTAIGELRDCGARISSCETAFYEMIGDARSPKFKEFLTLVKKYD